MASLINQAPLAALLTDWQSGHASSADLIARFRQANQMAQLPEKYGIVLEGILERIESASLFTEESCSFSKKDLADALQHWLSKASSYQAQA